MAQFQLSAELVAHENDVRAVAFPTPDIIASGSRDGTVRLWKRTDGTPTGFQPTTIASSPKQYFNSVAVLPGKSEDGSFHNRVMYSGTDQIIDIRDAENVDNDPRQLFGHEANVCALDASPSGSYIVSGSWDSRCIVWENYEAASLLDHDTGGPPRSVWAVLAYDDNTVITGSADTNIRMFDLRKSRQNSNRAQGFATIAADTTVQTPDVVRALCRLPTEAARRHPADADFASAGNDGVIRLWKITANGFVEKGQLHGHDSFIYSLAALEDGELVSSGEDRTVRIWKGTSLVQTITHPAISVWSVAVGPNNDIVSGASDGVVRVFTRNESRKADAEGLASFERSVASSSIPAPAMDRKNIPPKAWLDTNNGQKLGQIKTVLDDDGTILAYQWDGSGEWKLVGTVVEPPQSKALHNGQEYDFVWDVDIGPEQPMLKLPFNRGQDVYAAAKTFLEENNLPISYFEAVAAFINDNLGNQQGFSQGDGNPSDTKPAEKPYKWNALLPHTKYLHLVQSKLSLAHKKLGELNKTVDKAVQLNPRQLGLLEKLVDDLATSPERAIEYDVKLSVFTIVTKWPYDLRLPGLDFLRCIAAKEKGAKHNDCNALEAGVLGALNLINEDGMPPLAKIDMMKDVAWNQVSANHVMMALRVAANLFATKEGEEIMIKEAGPIISLLANIAGVAGAKTPFGEANANLQGALITVAFNYAALAYKERQKSPRQTNVSMPMLDSLLAIAGKVASTQENREFQFRAGMVAGNIAAIGGAELQLVRGASVTEWLEEAGKQGEGQDQRIFSVLDEIDTLLRGQ
ncbi:putative ubiquitin homeostasis protein [Podospora conica]|nr:putative ubiquitin homeostasis protein [Schizothecium conicum]